MATNPPAGYSFVDCNRKKRKAKFVSPLRSYDVREVVGGFGGVRKSLMIARTKSKNTLRSFGD